MRRSKIKIAFVMILVLICCISFWVIANATTETTEVVRDDDAENHELVTDKELQNRSAEDVAAWDSGTRYNIDLPGQDTITIDLLAGVQVPGGGNIKGKSSYPSSQWSTKNENVPIYPDNIAAALDSEAIKLEAAGKHEQAQACRKAANDIRNGSDYEMTAEQILEVRFCQDRDTYAFYTYEELAAINEKYPNLKIETALTGPYNNMKIAWSDKEKNWQGKGFYQRKTKKTIDIPSVGVPSTGIPSIGGPSKRPTPNPSLTDIKAPSRTPTPTPSLTPTPTQIPQTARIKYDLVPADDENCNDSFALKTGLKIDNAQFGVAKDVSTSRSY